MAFCTIWCAISWDVYWKLVRACTAADHIDNIFAAEDRKAAGVTAPADGLYFIHADYPAQFELPELPLGPHWLNMPE